MYFEYYADMAELADAYGSGPYECKFMQVQVLLSAPIKPDFIGLFLLYRKLLENGWAEKI